MLRLINKTKYILHKTLPYTDRSDFFINYLKFVIDHKRIPRNRKYFNDYLYRIKNTHEALDPLRQLVSDKHYMKLYVRAKVGEKYNIPTIKVFESFDELQKFDFPPNCCVKPTNASQEVILRKNNEPLDVSVTRKWFNLNYYEKTRERNYKYLKPKVIVEPLVFNSKDLTDYRIFCYKGKARLICIDIGKYSEYTRVFYDTSWNKQKFSLHYPLYKGHVKRPENLDEMINVAEALASEFNLIRIDLYSDGNSCLVGEITNCHAAASQSFIPLSSEKIASAIIFQDII